MLLNGWNILLIDYSGFKMHSSSYIILLMLLFIGSLCLFVRIYISKLKGRIEKERIFSNSIIDNANVLIMAWRIDGNIVLFNKFSQKITGYKEKQIIGKNWSMLVGKDSHFYTTKFNEMINNSNGVSLEKSIICKDGSKLYINWNIGVIKGANDEILYFVAIGNDISEKREAKQWINRLAYNDIHTGLPNKVKLQEQLCKMIEFTKKQNKKFSLIMFDLDNLKAINDNYSNAFTDKLLIYVVERLKRNLVKKMFFSRYRSDEFALILPGVNNKKQVEDLSQGILSIFNKPFIIDDIKIHLTVSIGVSIYPDHGETTGEIIRNADVAMRWVKENGKDNYKIYSKELTDRIIEKSLLEKDLRQAIERQELVIHYQPQIDMKTGKIHGFEALLRWEHSEKGTIPPMKFIPIAEETNLIIPLGEWVIRTACEQMKEFINEMNGLLYLSINLSAKQLQSENIVDTIEKILKETGFNPKYLQVEITETTAIKNPDVTIYILKKLSEIGISIALDDFGTGYSSLDYLNILPINLVKIDKSFIDELLISLPGKAAITEAIILLAHKLNMKVVAEGVEKREQLDVLRKYNCDIVQGYYYSKPIPFEQVKEWL